MSKTVSILVLLLAFLTGFALSLALHYGIPKSSTQSRPASPSKIVAHAEAPPPEPEKIRSGLPMRLNIPAINVDAAIEQIGLTSDGAMDVTKGPADVAWYKLGPRPGDNGSAVIAGHYGQWQNGDPSVFDKLHTLRAGDKIYVTDENGDAITFVVRESRRYDPNADASDVFSSQDRKPQLNLITCEGWDKASRGYSKRLVVFTDKE